MLNDRTCILCWTRGSLAVRLDRRGRPYGFCRSCMGRIFFHDARALHGLAVLPEQVDALAALASEDPILRAQFEGAVVELRAQLRGLLMPMTQPAPNASTTPNMGHMKTG